MRYGGCALHNKIELGAAVLFCGRHTGASGFTRTWVPFAFFLGAVLLFVYLL